MSISFNGIPTTLRVPFVYVEFDNSKAQQGASVQPYTTLLVGQKLAAGSKPELEVVSVSTEAEAIEYFGRGSMLHHMISKYRLNDKITELKVIAIDDAGASVKATGKFTIATGAVTKAGVFNFYVMGQKIPIAVSVGDDQDAIALALISAINADSNLPVTAAAGVGADECVVTAKNGGLVGNEIDLRINYYQEDKTPDGIAGVTVTAMASGAGNPDISEIIAVMPEDQFNVIVHPWTDSANLTLLETELVDRFGPIRQNDGVAFGCKLDTLGNLSTLGNGRNSPHSSILGPAKSSPNSSYEYASAYGAQVAAAAQADPGRPFQTLQLLGILPPAANERFSLQERNVLLTDGIATAKVDDTAVRIERSITTFQTNASGSPDTSYLDVNTLLILSYLRYDFRVTMAAKFPRSKLGSDGLRYGPGQKIVTPLVAKGVAIEIFERWAEDLALVENVDQFKRDLIVERSSQDPNRLDFLLSPDLINQLRVIGSQIAFLL